MDIDTIARKNFIWNGIGAGFSAMNSFLFLVIVTRVFGTEYAGSFSYAFTTSVVLSNIGLFNMRSVQITDIKKEYNDSTYLNSRIITTLVMMLGFVIMAAAKIHSVHLVLLLFFLGLWRIPETLADSMHGTFQINDSLHLAGKSLFLKALLGLVSFAVIVYGLKNEVIACAALIIVNITVFLAFDIRYYSKYNPNFHIFFDKKVKQLIFSCIPLCLISFLYSFLINAPKYAIDLFSTLENQTIFSIIIMPASVIWLLSTIVMNPLLPTLSRQYHSNQRRLFFKQIRNIILIIISAFASFVFLMLLIGIRVLEIVYRTDLAQYKDQFIITGIGAGLLCVASLFSYLLIILRENMKLLTSYVVVTIISLLISMILVNCYGLLGASISYLVSMVLFAVALILSFVRADKRNRTYEK